MIRRADNQQEKGRGIGLVSATTGLTCETPMLTNWTNNAVVFTILLVRGTCSAYSISRPYVYYDRIARLNGLLSVSLLRFASRVLFTLLYRA